MNYDRSLDDLPEYNFEHVQIKKSPDGISILFFNITKQEEADKWQAFQTSISNDLAFNLSLLILEKALDIPFRTILHGILNHQKGDTLPPDSPLKDWEAG